MVVGVVVVATNHGRVPNERKTNWPEKTREFATGTPATATNQPNRSVPDDWHTIPKRNERTKRYNSIRPKPNEESNLSRKE